MKLCKDCAHVRGKFMRPTSKWQCVHPADWWVSLIDGRTIQEQQWCDIERAGYGRCGPNGTYWHPSRWARVKAWVGRLLHREEVRDGE